MLKGKQALARRTPAYPFTRSPVVILPAATRISLRSRPCSTTHSNKQQASAPPSENKVPSYAEAFGYGPLWYQGLWAAAAGGIGYYGYNKYLELTQEKEKKIHQGEGQPKDHKSEAVAIPPLTGFTEYSLDDRLHALGIPKAAVRIEDIEVVVQAPGGEEEKEESTTQVIEDIIILGEKEQEHDSHAAASSTSAPVIEIPDLQPLVEEDKGHQHQTDESVVQEAIQQAESAGVSSPPIDVSELPVVSETFTEEAKTEEAPSTTPAASEAETPVAQSTEPAPSTQASEQKKEETDDLAITFEKPVLLVSDEKLGYQALSSSDALNVELPLLEYLQPSVAALLKTHGGVLYYYNTSTGGLELYTVTAEQMSNINSVLADIQAGNLKPTILSEEPDIELKAPKRGKDNLLVLNRETLEETVKADKDVFIIVHFNDREAVHEDLNRLAQIFAHDDSVVIASYDSQCNLPFPDQLRQGTDPELVRDSAIYFHYFPKNNKEHPVRFPIPRDGDLLTLTYSISHQRKTDIAALAQLLRRASVQKTVDQLQYMEDQLEYLRTLRSILLGKKSGGSLSIQEEEDKKSDDKLLTDIAGLREKTQELRTELEMNANDYKKKTKELQKRLIDAMYAVQQAVLKDVEKLPTETFNEELNRLLQELKGTNKEKVVVFFSRRGCGPCFDLSQVYSLYPRALPSYKFVWADAAAVGLHVTPRCYLYSVETGKEEAKLDYKECVTHIFDKIRAVRTPPPQPTPTTDTHSTAPSSSFVRRREERGASG